MDSDNEIKQHNNRYCHIDNNLIKSQYRPSRKNIISISLSNFFIL